MPRVQDFKPNLRQPETDTRAVQLSSSMLRRYLSEMISKGRSCCCLLAAHTMPGGRWYLYGKLLSHRLGPGVAQFIKKSKRVWRRGPQGPGAARSTFNKPSQPGGRRSDFTMYVTQGVTGTAGRRGRGHLSCAFAGLNEVAVYLVQLLLSHVSAMSATLSSMLMTLGRRRRRTCIC
jgi:hypothetical protein